MADAIVAEGLIRRFGSTVALEGLDLTVREGTVTGLLGPNGAGKTTAVRVLSTLLRPDSGRAVVAGLDVRTDAVRLRGRIGLSGQYAAVDDDPTARENLTMIGRLYHLGAAASVKRADELLERFDLTEHADRLVKATRVACVAGWTWRVPWCPSRRCCSWMSRRPDSMYAAGSACGR
jgi:ABC-2 type transport system ATP-binding protein